MKMTWKLKFPYKIKFISLVQLCFLVKEVLSLLAPCILGSHPYFSWLPNFGNGLLETLWGWGAFMNRRNFFSWSNSVYEFFLGRIMNIF